MEHIRGTIEGASYAGALQGTIKVDSKPIFLNETDLFGPAKPTKDQWLSNVELYNSLGITISAEDILGIQRVGSLCRLFIDKTAIRVALLSTGVTLRGVNIPFYEKKTYIPDRTDQLNSN